MEQRPSGGAVSDLAIELKAINKRFGPVWANRDIDLKVKRGTIHGIVGENGAGKSTLMSILFGFYQADSGEISVDGKVTRIATPTDAIKAGVVSLGVAEQGVGLAMDDNNKPLITADAQAAVDAATKGIADGSIKVHDYMADSQCP